MESLSHSPRSLSIQKFLLVTAVVWLMAWGAFAQQPSCRVQTEPLINGKTSTGTMHLDEDTVCRFRLGATSIGHPDSWELVAPPRSGTVTFDWISLGEVGRQVPAAKHSNRVARA